MVSFYLLLSFFIYSNLYAQKIKIIPEYLGPMHDYYIIPPEMETAYFEESNKDPEYPLADQSVYQAQQGSIVKQVKLEPEMAAVIKVLREDGDEQYEEFQKLVKKIKINQRCKLTDDPLLHGMTPLIFACTQITYQLEDCGLYFMQQHGVRYMSKSTCLNCIEFMLTIPELDPNKRQYMSEESKGGTALTTAAFFQNYDVCQALLSHKDIDVNARDHGGFSALHFACKNGDLKLIALLVTHGANINVQDFFEKNTPAHLLLMCSKITQKERLSGMKFLCSGKQVIDFLLLNIQRRPIYYYAYGGVRVYLMTLLKKQVQRP